MTYYVGLMSGTSVDAVDAVLVRFSPELELLAANSTPIPPALKQQILTLAGGRNESIDRLCSLDVTLADLFADSVNTLLDTQGVARSDVAAIGSHGQTIRHRPERGFTLQLGDPSRIVERTGIKTIADFRRRDVAAGGQGAPLVPAFHQSLFRSTDKDRVIINIGGMANLTSLPVNAQKPVLGFDTGPGNVLMDEWIYRHKGLAYDADGQWAASGEVVTPLLEQLLAEPFFSQPAPKSTGRELFSLQWMNQHLLDFPEAQPEDVQATLSELTARSISDAVMSLGLETPELYICGGGAHNRDLLQRIRTLAGKSSVGSTDTLGLNPDWVEAVAFAWLAWRADTGLSGNLPAVTGASGERILGAIYPA